MSGTQPGTLVQRESGILIPSSLVPDQTPHLADRIGARPTVYDGDGRRRVVLPKALQKTLDRVLLELGAAGLGMLVGCRTRWDEREACGEPLINEGRGTPDPGYGCRCTRVHFQ